MCASLGVPHSQFLGGPAVWSELDRAKALAYRRRVLDQEREDALLCRGCGTDPRIWIVGDDGVPALPFVARLHECGGCAQIESLQAQVQAAPEAERERGLRIQLVPNLTAERVLTDG